MPTDGLRKMMEEVAEEATRRLLDKVGHDFGFGQEWLSEEQAARLLAFSPRTLERLRADGEGPATVRVGRHVRYPRAAVLDWARARAAGGAQ